MILSFLITTTITQIKMNTIKYPLVLLALFFSTIVTALSQTIPGGFGNDLRMKQTISIIVPSDWVVRATTEVLDKKVTWVGDVDWKDVLTNISNDNDFSLKMDVSSKSITLRQKEVVSQTKPIQPPVEEIKIKTPTPVVIQPTVKVSEVDITPTNVTPLAPSGKKIDDTYFINNVGNTISSLFEDKPAPTPVMKTPPTPELPKETKISSSQDAEAGVIISPQAEPATQNSDVQAVVNKIAVSVLKLFEPAPRIMTEDEVKFHNLLTTLDIPVTDLFVEKTNNQRDNIVKFYFSFTSNDKKVDSFVLFNKDTVYSPYLTNVIVLEDWYYTNYTHPPKINTNMIKPIKTNQVLFNRDIVAPVPKVINKVEQAQFLKTKEYLAYRGEMLSTVFGRWSQDINASLVWKFDSDFKITKEIRMYSNFLEAVNQMLAFYNATSNPLQTRFFLKNKTLLVEELSIIYREK